MERRPSSILIIKLSAIGDVVHALPFLEVLRKNHPSARIDWIVEEEASSVVEGHEAIDRLFVSRRKPWQKRLAKFGNPLPVVREMTRFMRQIRGRRYDLIIDLQGLLKSAVLAGLARGGEKIGLRGVREGGWMFYNRPLVPVDIHQHAIDRYLQAAASLNCKPSSWTGKIPVTERDMGACEALSRLSHIRGKPLIAINPMARWPTKLWSPEKFALLADRIYEELSGEVVFTGSEADRPAIRDLSARMRHPSVNFAGRTSLKELACLYARCRVLVCTDTGPMHIASAMGCRVVALFGPTAPLRTGPYGNGHRVIQAETECRPCFKKRCAPVLCMASISVDRVFDAVREVVSDNGKGQLYKGA